VDDRGLCREVLFWRGARELRGTTETLTEAGLSVEVAEIDAPPDGGRVLMATGTSAGCISTSCNGGGNWGVAVNVNTVGLWERPGSLED